MSGAEVALVPVSILAAVAAVGFVWHVWSTRHEARAYRDLLRQLGEKERELDAAADTNVKLGQELEQRKKSEAAAVALAAKRKEELDAIRGDAEDARDDELVGRLDGDRVR